MNCEHEVRFTIKPTDDACRFHFDVRTYKDRIVAPDEYSGATTVTPSDDAQTLPTKDKTVRSDITVLPAPTEPLATNENGTFTPSDGAVGFSEVTVDIVPALDSLTVTENGLYLPESGVDGYDRVSVDVPWPSGSMTITENGTYDVAGYASAVVDVNVVPDLRPLSVSENGQYSPDGFDGYSGVTVDVEPNLTSLSVAENGLYLPESGTDGFDRVSVDVPIPTFETEEKTINANGVYLPSAGKDGISKVTVNVPVSDWSAPTLVYEGDFDAVTSAFSVTELPNGDPFSFDKIIVELSHVQQGQNVNKRTYWRSDCPVSGYNEPLITDGGSQYRYNVTYHAITTIEIEDDTYIGLVAVNYDENNPTSTAQAYQRKAHGGYNKITAYAWWSWNCPAGAHIKITGYNRTS